MRHKLRRLGVASVAAAMLFAPTAWAFGANDQRDAIAALCSAQIPLSANGCACFTERAMDDLDADERNYLILSSTRPGEAERPGVATSSDREEVAEFLEETPAECGAMQPAEPAGGGGMQSAPGLQVN